MIFTLLAVLAIGNANSSHVRHTEVKVGKVIIHTPKKVLDKLSKI
jgi:hypothetical protein